MARTARKTAPHAPKAAETKPATGAEPQTAVPEPPESPAERPVKSLTFFEKLKRLHPDDWGTRANIYLYRLEPITDRLKGGNSFVFVQKYDEPIDQDKVISDQGSGKYRAVLTFKKSGENGADQVDNTVFEILNTNFPPKIPPGEWVNDARNKKWAWAAPPSAMAPPNGQQPATPFDDTVEKFRLFRDITNDLKEEARVQNPPPAAPAVDPYTTAMGMAKDLLQMRSDNPMVDVLRDELKEMRLEMRAERERSQKLQDELRSKESQPAKPGLLGLGGISELVAEAQKIGLIPEGGLKSLWGKAEGALQAVSRSRMTGTEEFLQPILVQFAEAAKPVIPMLVHRWMQPQQQPQQPQQPGAAALPQAQPQQPAANGTPPAATAAPAPDAPRFDQQQALAFFSNFAQSFVKFFQDEQTGGDFAAYIHEGYGADWEGVKWLWLKTQVPTERIVDGFKATPLWPEIAASEAKFTEYVQEFVDWQPAAADTVVDLEEQEQEPAQ